MTKQDDFNRLCKLAKLFYDTYSPGDGVTRYRFFAEPTKYFFGDGLHNCLGLRDAIQFVTGYIAGLNHNKN